MNEVSEPAVLVADDEADVREAYRTILQAEPARPPDSTGGSGSPAASEQFQALRNKLFGAAGAAGSVSTTPQTPRHARFQLTLCCQGDEAIEAVRQALAQGRPYPLAFLDMRMPPGRDGVATAEQIRLLDPHINLVIVTGFSDYSQQAIAERIAPADKLLYLRKPFSADEIRQFAVALSAKWQAEQNLRHHQTQLEALNQHLQLYAKIIDSTGEGVVVTDAKTQIMEVNPAYCRITGFARHELIGQKPGVNKAGHHDQNFYYRLWEQLNQYHHWAGEIWNRRKSGELYPTWQVINAICDARNHVSHYVSVVTDISEAKETQQRLNQLAYYDALTGLANRVLFHDRLEHELAMAARHNKQVAVLFLDLDRFKEVNDTQGHSVGDQLLIEIARRLDCCTRKTDTVARFGGDEFTVIVSDVVVSQAVTLVVENLIKAISGNITLSEQVIYVTTSVGIALYPKDGTTGETLLRNADTAMYAAKQGGRNTYRFYTDGMQENTLRRINLECALRESLNQNGAGLVLYYQPKLDLVSGQLTGVEALIRWQLPDEMLLLPDMFIPLAEESGLIVPLGYWVLKTACRQLKIWHDEGLTNLRMAVNLSPRQFDQPDLADEIATILLETNLAAEYLELEITENVLLHNIDNAVVTMMLLKKMGVRIAVDDFGMGYASLNSLKRFPIDVLKIDKSFVRDLGKKADSDSAIITSIISMAHNLSLKVIAEGVETIEQLQFLRTQGCQEMQGYYYSVPLPAESLKKLLTSGTPFL